MGAFVVAHTMLVCAHARPRRWRMRQISAISSVTKVARPASLLASAAPLGTHTVGKGASAWLQAEEHGPGGQGLLHPDTMLPVPKPSEAQPPNKEFSV